MTEIAIIFVILGSVSQYDPGVMEKVVLNQQRWGRLPQGRLLDSYDGFVAVADCSRIGEDLYLRPAGANVWERFLVVDCAGDQAAREWMRTGRILAEVDAQTAQRWGIVGRGAVVEAGKRIRRFAAL